MLMRHRKTITILVVAGLILAAVFLARFAPISIVRVGPTSTPSPTAMVRGQATREPVRIAIPALIAQSTGSPGGAPTTTPPPTTLPPPTATSPPTPTPLRLPPRPANGSKLGVHGIRSNRILAFTQTLADAGAPFRAVKAVDDLAWLKDVKRVSAGTVTVGRLTHDHEGAPLVNDPNTDLDWYAAVLMDPILTKLQADPALREAVDYWELTNEPLGGGAPADAYARLAQLTIKCLEIGEANGLRLAIFGFNAGTPEWADMVAMAETGVFAGAKTGGHIVTLHEGVFGDAPIDKWWNTHAVDQDGNPTTEHTGMTAPGGWIPGAPVLDGAGALSLRYRFLYHLLRGRGEVVPLFVSEFYAGGDYDPDDKADVIARMHWYDLRLAEDDYVLGFAPFTLGPTSRWTGQDHEPFYEGHDGLVAYAMGMGE